MKILTISNCPLVESQGSGYGIINYCRALQERGHEVEVYGPESFIPFKFLQSRAMNYRIAVGMLILTLKKITRKKYDILEFYGAPSWLTIIFLRMLIKRKFIIVNHSNGIENHDLEVQKKYAEALGERKKWFQWDQSLLFEKAFKNSDGIVVVSSYDAEYILKKKYIKNNKLKTINYGLLDDYLNLPVEFERKPCIGFFGSWLPRKGIQSIITDVNKILHEYSELRFILIGVGSDFLKESYFDSKVLSQIEVIPFISDKKELKKLYQSISISLIPSIYESFGLVIAEAMACGCAVVAARTGFAAELLHEKEAWLMPEPNSPHLYEGIKTLLTNESLRLRIAQGGYTKVQNLNWQTSGDILERTYKEWSKS